MKSSLETFMTCENCKRLELELAKAQSAMKHVADGLRGQRGSCLNCDSAVRYLDNRVTDTTALDSAIFWMLVVVGL